MSIRAASQANIHHHHRISWVNTGDDGESDMEVPEMGTKQTAGDDLERAQRIRRIYGHWAAQHLVDLIQAAIRAGDELKRKT